MFLICEKGETVQCIFMMQHDERLISRPSFGRTRHYQERIQCGTSRARPMAHHCSHSSCPRHRSAGRRRSRRSPDWWQLLCLQFARHVSIPWSRSMASSALPDLRGGPVVELRGVHKPYSVGLPNETEVLHGIDLVLQRGDFCAVMGPSGSG